jgi:Circadian oscillating protein COP23
MKPIVTTQFLSICIAAISMPILPQLAQAQLPAIVDPTTPAAPTATSSNASEPAIAKLEVSCQGLKTVVKKGKHQATMVTWNTNHFGRDFNNEKRCQVVSERLQKAANLNGGTFQGLELASGTVNFQPVICALQNGSKKCNGDNFLFTLKPENAKNPDAVIQQIVQFGEDGSGTVEESARSKAKVDRSLGNWERKVFAKSKSTTNSTRNIKKGF